MEQVVKQQMATIHLAQVQQSSMWLHILQEQPATVEQVVKQHLVTMHLAQVQVTST